MIVELVLIGGTYMSSGPEKLFENKIKKYLVSKGIHPLGSAVKDKSIGYYEKRWGGGTFTKSGLPDLHVSIRGLSLEFELKAEKGVLAELQKFTIEQINKSGGYGTVVYPNDFDSFCTTIDYVIKNKKLPK